MKREITANQETEIKSPPYQKAQEREFARMAERMIDIISERFKNQAIKALNASTVDKFADAQVGNYAKVFLALAKRVSRKMVKQFDDDRIEQATKTMLNKVNKANRESLYGMVEKRIGISSTELFQTEGLRTTVNALDLETAQWMKRLRDDTLEFYTANTLRVMANGGSIADVLAELSNVEGKRKDHAKFTARNQIASYNSLMTKARAQNLGITQAKWVTAGDERVRPCHNVRNGKEFELSEGLYSSCDKKTLLPGIDYQCRCTYDLIIPED